MEWLNLHSSTLDSPEVVGAEPVDRATWLFLLRYCIGQENGGSIAACADWGDRKWQQLVRVTLGEVKRESPLWRFVGDALQVNFYPAARQKEIEAKRQAGKDTVAKRWGKQDCLANSSAIHSADTEGEGEGERKDKGKEKGKEKNKRVCFSPPSAEDVSEYAKSIGYPMDGQAWCDSYAQKGWMVGKTKMKDWRAAVRNWKSQGWTPSAQSPAAREPAPHSWEAQDKRRVAELMKDEETAARLKLMFAPELAEIENK